MDAIHGKVGLPNFVLSQPGHVRQQPDTIDHFAEKPCGGYLWTSRTLFTLLFMREEKQESYEWFNHNPHPGLNEHRNDDVRVARNVRA